MITCKAIKCPECKTIIYSRARHDFRSCTCGKCSIDGGFDYIRVVCDTKIKIPEAFDIEVNATKKELYDDWNSIDKNIYGLIKETE